MLLDVLHLLHTFICPGLPDEYEEFKSLVKETFPNIVDTKVLATNLPFKEYISDHSLGKNERYDEERIIFSILIKR